MTFDWHISFGTVITLVGVIVGGLGSYFTIKFGLKSTMEKLADLTRRFDADTTKNMTQHEENQRRLASMDLQIARDCVKIDDFRRLEDRFAAKFEKIEHAVNNAGLKTAGIIKDALRDVLGPRGGRE